MADKVMKAKVFSDFSAVQKIAEIIGVEKTLDLINRNLYEIGRYLTSSDVESLYDSRYFAGHERLPIRRVVNGFRLHYYCLFAFEFLEREFSVNGKKVLDVGCGNGELCLALASIGYDVKGIDFSKPSIANAESRRALAGHLAGNVNFEVADIETIQGNYDYVIFSDVVEHLAMAELDKILSKVRQLLTRDGRLVIHTPNGRVRTHRLGDDYLGFSLMQRIYRGFVRIKKRIRRPQFSEQDLLHAYYSQTHINVMTPKQMKGLLERSGYANSRWFYRMDRRIPLEFILLFCGCSTDMGVVAQCAVNNEQRRLPESVGW